MIEKEKIASIKASVDLVALVKAKGIELKKNGKGYFGLCPFHDDKEPSLIVTPDKNLWNCLGACQSGGSVIDWVMKMEKVDFVQAVEILQKKWFLTPVKKSKSNDKNSKKAAAKEDKPSFNLAAEDNKLLSQVVDFYHDSLKKSPEALEYLKGRGLDNPEMVDYFKLGLSNRTLGYSVPAKSTAQGKKLRARLQDLGFFRKSGHEHFNGCLVVPVLDGRGQVKEI